MCNFTIEVSGTIEKGKEVTFRLQPPVQYPCQFEVEVNGEHAEPGDHGALHVVGIGATGTITVRPLSDKPWGSIAFKVRCPNCPGADPKLVMPGGEVAPQPQVHWLGGGYADPPPPPPLPPQHDDDDEVIKIFGIPVWVKKGHHPR